MIDVDCECAGLPLKTYALGEVVIEEGGLSGALYFLRDGKVEVRREGVVLAEVDERGALFGEISILLGRPHIAEVKASETCTFHVAEDVERFLREHPAVNLYIARSLARKVDHMSAYLVDLKQQYAGEESHLGMVHEVLDSLLEPQR